MSRFSFHRILQMWSRATSYQARHVRAILHASPRRAMPAMMLTSSGMESAGCILLVGNLVDYILNVCGYRVCTGVRTSPIIEDKSKERWTAMDAYGHIEVTFSRARNTQLPPAQRSVVVQTFHGFTTTDHDGRVCAEFEIRSRQRRRCVYTATVVRAWFEPE